MKEMKYSSFKQLGMNEPRKYEILDEGEYGGYHYVIVSFFSHPCAYIELPQGHLYYGQKYDDIPIDCHYGLTYSCHYLLQGTTDEKCGFWIGWDYAHMGDWASYFTEAEALLMNLKKWTTAEILEEVKKVIEQLIDKEKALMGEVIIFD